MPEFRGDVYPNPEALLELLNQEIESAQGEQERSGWTLWALTGALGAVAIVLLDIWQTGGFSLQLVARWIVVIGLPIDALTSWLWTWSTHDPLRSHSRYRLFREFEHHRVAYIWLAGHALVMGWVAYYASEDVWRPAVFVAVGWYILIALFSILTIALASADITFEEQRQPQALVQFGVLFGFVIVLGAGTYAYADTLHWIEPGTSTAELRIAGLSVLASLLIYRLLLGLRRPWFVSKLVKTRRELVLGKIDVSAAARAVEITLLGMEVKTALEEHLSRTAEFQEDLENAELKARMILQPAAAELAGVEQKWPSMPEEQREQFADYANRALDDLRGAMSLVNKREQHLRKHMTSYEDQDARFQNEQPVAYVRARNALLPLQQETQRRNAALFAAAINLQEEVASFRSRSTALQDWIKDLSSVPKT